MTSRVSLVKRVSSPKPPSEQSHFDDQRFINTLWRPTTERTPAVLNTQESKALCAGTYLLMFNRQDMKMIHPLQTPLTLL